MEKVRFGIIGVGNIGLSHVKHLLAGRITNGVLGAVCDLKPNKLNNVNGLEGGDKVAKFSDYKELLASGLVDCVIVAVPHFLHPSICIEALNAGLHVICEKPAGVYTKQVKEMNDVAEKSDKLFTMMFNQRTNELYQQMHDIVHSGGIGEIKRVNWIITNWYRPQSYYDSGDWRATWSGEGGGVLMNQCPHQIDLLQWIVGMLPTRVHSFCHWGKWHDIEVEDDVTAYFEYENGATGVFVTSTGDTPGTNRFEILGDKGKLICENGKLTYYKLKVSEREFNATYKGGFGEPEKEEIELPAPAPCPQHVGIMNNFANAILGLEPLMVNGLEGLRGVQITDAMLLSSWLGETVTLPIDDDLYLAELNKRIATSRRKVASDTVLSTDGTY